MPMRALLFLAAAMAANPVLSADPPKRNPGVSVGSWFIATPSEVPTLSADKGNDDARGKRPKRVRYTIPAPTRM